MLPRSLMLPLVAVLLLASCVLLLCAEAVSASCQQYGNAAWGHDPASSFTTNLDNSVDVYPISIPASPNPRVLSSVQMQLAPNPGLSANIRVGVFALDSMLTQSASQPYAGSARVVTLSFPLLAPYTLPINENLTVYVGSSSDNEYIRVFTSTQSEEGFTAAASFPPADRFPDTVQFSNSLWDTVPYAVTACHAVAGQSDCSFSVVCSSEPAALPAAFFNLTFPAPRASHYPSESYGTWSWQQDDLLEFAPCHSGLASFNSSLQQYINLSLPDGPSTGGAALPSALIGGRGRGDVDNGTAGWSFELTFRYTAEAYGSLLFALGGPDFDFDSFTASSPAHELLLGVASDGSGLLFADFEAPLGQQSESSSAALELVNPVGITDWHHVVVVLQQLTAANTEHGAWWLWLDGQLLNYTAGGIQLSSLLPAAVHRPFSYLGLSEWSGSLYAGGINYEGVSYLDGLIDTFRIYDVALTGEQVQTAYQGEMGACAVPVQPDPVSLSHAPNVVLKAEHEPLPKPFYSLDFTVDPRLATNATGYGWERVSPFDSAEEQQLHRGILTLDRNGQYVDLGAVSGPNAVKTEGALGVIGGGQAGWSFEFTVKPGRNAQWQMLMDIGSTRNESDACVQDLVLGWDATTPQWQFSICDALSNQYQTPDAFNNINPYQWSPYPPALTAAFTAATCCQLLSPAPHFSASPSVLSSPVLVRYHMVAVVAPSSGSPGLANYFTYINGRLYNSLVNAYYPPAVPRENAWLGRSGWGDPYMIAELDSFSIYDSALSPKQVTTLFSRAFPQGADTAPAAGGAADEFELPGGVHCTGYGSANQPPNSGCNDAFCVMTEGSLSLVQVLLPPSVVTVTHLGLFQLGSNYGQMNFKFGLYFLNTSAGLPGQLQLLVQTAEVEVAQPGVSTPYVIAGLEPPQRFTVPDWAVDNLWVANWISGSALYVNLLSGYSAGLSFENRDGVEYSTEPMPDTIDAAHASAWPALQGVMEAQDLLYCDTTASLIGA